MVSTGELEAALRAALDEHDVPGASCALAVGDDVTVAAAGTANLATGAPVTPDTRFLIGSVSKLFTMTLVVGLCGEQDIDLDTPVREHLGDGFRLADGDATDRVTIRHLLSHTSGVQGDHFEDFGRGDDAIERYVDSMAGLDLIHPLGAHFSYCNSGYVLAGRLVEVLTDRPYRHALRERIVEPLGLEAALLPEEAILGPVAVGHTLATPDGPAEVVASWMLPYAMAPAGSIICATPSDLLRFAAAHGDDGAPGAPGAPGATAPLLDDDARATSQRWHVGVPSPRPTTGMGLSWWLDEVGGHRVLHHGGATTGQVAKLWLLPDDGIALATTTNGARGGLVNRDLANLVGRDLLGADLVPPPPDPRDDLDLDLDVYVGAYERLRFRVEVERTAEGLLLRSRMVGMDGEEVSTPEPRPLFPVGSDHFRLGDGADAAVISFTEPDDDGRPRFLYAGRLARRAA